MARKFLLVKLRFIIFAWIGLVNIQLCFITKEKDTTTTYPQDRRKVQKTSYY